MIGIQRMAAMVAVLCLFEWLSKKTRVALQLTTTKSWRYTFAVSRPKSVAFSRRHTTEPQRLLRSQHRDRLRLTFRRLTTSASPPDLDLAQYPGRAEALPVNWQWLEDGGHQTDMPVSGRMFRNATAQRGHAVPRCWT
jgi:hypothetical protein